MLKKTPAFFGDQILNLSLPTSWDQLSDEQLRYVCYLLVRFDIVTVKTYLFIRLTGIRVEEKRHDGWLCSLKISAFRKVRFSLADWQIQSFISQLDFIEQSTDRPVRLSKIGRHKAAHPLLRGIVFQDYIALENLYQGYLITQNNDLLQQMAALLYSSPGRFFKKRYSEEECLSVFHWYSSLKNFFSKTFKYFFSSASSDGGDPPNMMDVMNAEIRALTGGDITKEKEILNMDCWRALTELNEKARETKEHNEKYGNK